jgi:uncharacterized protein
MGGPGPSDAVPSGKALLALAETSMPLGRYQGRVILDLPDAYLLWFQQKGFPAGNLGRLMALALEIKVNGLEGLVDEALRHDGQGRPRKR